MQTLESSRARHIPGEEGIWVFILGDMIIFGLLFGTYLHDRNHDVAQFNSSQLALNADFGLANTLLLLFSSLLVVVAVSTARGGKSRPASLLILGAVGCGLAFSALKVAEWTSEIAAGNTPGRNSFFTFYFALTGLHWFHLIIGLGVLTYMFFSVRRPILSVTQFAWIEGGGCFWHMVDLLWIVLFPLLYLVN